MHQEGCAIDISLATILEMESFYAGAHHYRKPVDYFEFLMPTDMHELSIWSVMLDYPIGSGNIASLSYIPYSEGMKNSEGAQRMQKYCMDVGLSPLASEWWHFNDWEARERLPERGVGNFYITKCLSIAP
jgi:D-alanyl-D-alanine dipeptidase